MCRKWKVKMKYDDVEKHILLHLLAKTNYNTMQCKSSMVYKAAQMILLRI